jgi:hypothetical protein
MPMVDLTLKRLDRLEKAQRETNERLGRVEKSLGGVQESLGRVVDVLEAHSRHFERRLFVLRVRRASLRLCRQPSSVDTAGRTSHNPYAATTAHLAEGWVSGLNHRS